MKIDDGNFNVLAVGGDSNLGGEDFDYILFSNYKALYRIELYWIIVTLLL